MSHPWQYVAPVLLISIPTIFGALIITYAQVYWPYQEPKDYGQGGRRSQREVGIEMVRIEPNSAAEERTQPSASVVTTEWATNDADAIEAV